MAGIDTAKTLVKKTKKQFSSLTVEERGNQLTLRFVGDSFTLGEAGGPWRLACTIPVPAALKKKNSETKLREWFESLDPKEPYADRPFQIQSEPAQGGLDVLHVSIQWDKLDGVTPAELVTALNSLRTGAMYVRTRIKELQ